MATARRGFTLEELKTRIYLVSDVARYARLHPSTARSWVAFIPGREPDLPPGEGLSFPDLISILMMRELRRVGVPARSIRHAEDYLTRELGPYPFARHRIWTDGHHVLFSAASPLRTEVPEPYLVSADRGGQQAFVELIRQYLRSILYSQEGIAIEWRPSKRVQLTPFRQFGQPCIEGTRVPTQAIYLLHEARDTDTTIMKAFDISAEDVGEAIRWEQGLMQKAA